VTTRARRAAERYVELVNAVDLEGLAALFAPDATLLHPTGVYDGRDAIRAFYAESVVVFAPEVVATSWVEADEHCVFEMEARAGGEAVAQAIDRVTVDAGGAITRLAIYFR